MKATTIININEMYGDQVTFDGNDLPGAISEMANAIVSLGYNDGQTVDDLCNNLREGTDYEVVY